MAQTHLKSAESRKAKNGKKKSSVFRLLPLVIFFCALMLSVRVGVVWRNLATFDAKTPAVAVTPVQAAAKTEPSAAPSSKVAQAAASGNRGKSDKKGLAGRGFSQSELEILQKLAKRREELDVRERGIDQKAGVLKAAEAQIDAKIAKLKELEASIKELVGVYDQKERERLTNLVKIYSTMKPKEAARLFNDMDMSLLTRVFEQMKESKSAPILALMDSAKANALTSELANKKTLPGYGEPEDGAKK